MTGQANLRVLDEYQQAERVHAALHARDDLVAELALRDQARRDRRIDACLQLAIALLTLWALWLVTSASPLARWGHVVGLISQPFYMLATWRARQWGMLFVAVALCGLWTRGIVNHFFF